MAPNGSPRRVADVLLRAVPLVASLDELADLRALAEAHYAAGIPQELDRAIRVRRRDLLLPAPTTESVR